jgi:hypothetical protein
MMCRLLIALCVAGLWPVTLWAAPAHVSAKEVVGQSGEGLPATWGVNEGKPVPAYYKMNAEITGSAEYRDGMEAALKAIPAMWVVMNEKDLFDAARGIYASPKQAGKEWERPASVELTFPDGRAGFRIDCGIRIQGGWSRRPEESPKHSFRLLFKSKYGPARLEFPLFGEAGGREFDTLILRGGNNNTWLHWSGEERRRADFIRDQWMRDTHRAMGYPAARGVFVHLYLNGLYWGLYNLTERPDATFVAGRQGGSRKDYDSQKAEKAIEGDKVAWDKMLKLANAGLGGEAEYRAICEMLDMPAFIDFMILNLYGGNADWDRHSNWYAARRRNPPGRFQFLIWDGERSLEAIDANVLDYDDDQSPPRLFQKLRANARFRAEFAERVQRHFFNGGALTAEAGARRFQFWSDQLDAAVVAESARWGAYRRDVQQYKVGPYELYTRNEHWRPEIRRLLGEYFPKRGEAVLKQFREAGLYPKVDAPVGRY